MMEIQGRVNITRTWLPYHQMLQQLVPRKMFGKNRNIIGNANRTPFQRAAKRDQFVSAQTTFCVDRQKCTATTKIINTTTRQLAILKIKTQVLFNYGVNFGKLSASEEAEVENTFSINHMLGKVQVLISVSHREL